MYPLPQIGQFQIKSSRGQSTTPERHSAHACQSDGAGVSRACIRRHVVVIAAHPSSHPLPRFSSPGPVRHRGQAFLINAGAVGHSEPSLRYARRPESTSGWRQRQGPRWAPRQGPRWGPRQSQGLGPAEGASAAPPSSCTRESRSTSRRAHCTACATSRTQDATGWNGQSLAEPLASPCAGVVSA